MMRELQMLLFLVEDDGYLVIVGQRGVRSDFGLHLFGGCSLSILRVGRRMVYRLFLDVYSAKYNTKIQVRNWLS